jgi:hypothetical protein
MPDYICDDDDVFYLFFQKQKRVILNLDGLSSRMLSHVDMCNTQYGSSWQTRCIMKTNPLLSSLFLPFGTRMPYLQIISPDLSVTVFVMLH